mmetsp:Transcript_31427/g.57000  ORF Transcript_31427/g.57000 Transcript_31427/m.57000 type:complete len:213 (-) Transcript_31427:295-933(-)
MAVLSPRTHDILTNNGEGAGILSRLEAEVRKRAEEEWRRTGGTPEVNWTAAERQIVLAPASAGGLDEQRALKREAELLAELDCLKKQVEEAERKAEGSQIHLKVKSLQKELSETDRLMVERNQRCREVELSMGHIQEKFNAQVLELASRDGALQRAQEELQATRAQCQAEKERNKKLEYALKEVLAGSQAVIAGCRQRQSKIYRSQSTGTMA